MSDRFSKHYNRNLHIFAFASKGTFHHLRQVCVEGFLTLRKSFLKKSERAHWSLQDSWDVGVMNISQEFWISDRRFLFFFPQSVLSSGSLRCLIIDSPAVDKQLQMAQFSLPNPTFLSVVPCLMHAVEHITGSCQQPQQGALQPQFPAVSHWAAPVEQLDTLMAHDECSPFNYPTRIFSS